MHEAIPVLREVREYELRALAILKHEGGTTCCNLVWIMTTIGQVLKQAPQSEERIVQVCGIQRSNISQERRFNLLTVWELGKPSPEVSCELLQSSEPWLVRKQVRWPDKSWVIPCLSG